MISKAKERGKDTARNTQDFPSVFKEKKKMQPFRCGELNVILSHNYSIMGRQLFRWNSTGSSPCSLDIRSSKELQIPVCNGPSPSERPEGDVVTTGLNCFY